MLCFMIWKSKVWKKNPLKVVGHEGSVFMTNKVLMTRLPLRNFPLALKKIKLRERSTRATT